jgi:hypothetical protein
VAEERIAPDMQVLESGSPPHPTKAPNQARQYPIMVITPSADSRPYKTWPSLLRSTTVTHTETTGDMVADQQHGDNEDPRGEVLAW